MVGDLLELLAMQQQQWKNIWYICWIDFSSTDVGTILEVEDVETSTLTTPTLEFDYFSDNGTYSLSSANNLYVEAYDGSTWNIIDSLQVLVSGWNTYQYSLNGYLNGTVAEIRFRGESSDYLLITIMTFY